MRALNKLLDKLNPLKFNTYVIYMMSKPRKSYSRNFLRFVLDCYDVVYFKFKGDRRLL